MFLDGLNSPFGMALAGDQQYVANTDAVLRFPYQTGQTRISAPSVKMTDLPAGHDHHWIKNLIASADGTRLYASVGSNSNVIENGMAEEKGRAAIWEIDLASGAKCLYATGLRNPVGVALDAQGTLLVADDVGNAISVSLPPARPDKTSSSAGAGLRGAKTVTA